MTDATVNINFEERYITFIAIRRKLVLVCHVLSVLSTHTFYILFLFLVILVYADGLW